MMKGTIPSSAWIFWAAAGLLSALLSLGTLHNATSTLRREGMAGWLLATALAAAGPALLAGALGRDSTRFLLLGVGGQLVRLGILLAFFVYFTQVKNFSFLGFVSCGFISYLLHLFAEVAWLARRSLTAGPTS